MKLELSRPLIIFDLETTGTAVNVDRIIQIGTIKIFPDGKQEKKCKLVNPQVTIPTEAVEVHGITDEMVKDEPCFKSYSKALYKYFSGCDILGYNCIAFDVQLLAAEFNRAGLSHPFMGAKIIDAYTIFKKREARTLVAALKFYCNKELVDAHSALADAEATLDVVLKQMEIYSDIGADVESLAAYCCDSEYADLARKIEIINGEFCFAFGKHKGKRIVDEQGYAQWMLSNDFPVETKEIIRQVLKEVPVKC
jgi:DNA polymerase-3 subunit epsilon